MSDKDTTVRVYKDVWSKALKYCKNNGIKNNWFATEAIREKLERMEHDANAKVHAEEKKE